MRLVGVLATCFILLAALIYGFQHRKEFGLRIADRVEEMLPPDVAEVDAFRLPVASSVNQAIIPMREAGRLNALAGFPGFAKATFALPRVASVRSGILILELSGEVDNGAKGVLRIAVNGVRRTEIVVDEGRLRRRIMVPLNTRDLSGKDLVVNLVSEGRVPQVVCTEEWSGGIVAQIMPISHLKLELASPITDPVDVLLSKTAPLKLDWPEDATLQAATLKAAHVWPVENGDVIFAHDGQGGLAIDHAILAAMEAQGVALKMPEAFDLDLVADIGRKRSLTFHDEAQWRFGFDRRHFASGSVASELDLRMKYATAGDDAGWLLSVRLNDRLVHAEELDAASGEIARKLALPVDDQPLLNDLRVTLTSAQKLPGGCESGMSPRPATADIELAHLTLEVPVASSEWPKVLEVLAGDIHLAVHHGLDANGAQIAHDLLNSIDGGKGLSLNTGMSDSAKLPLMTVVAGHELDQFLTQVRETDTWIFAASESSNDGVHLVRVADLEGPVGASAPRAVLVIEARPHYSSVDARQ
ncbi:hypothetical protein [Antarctobacter jejuensis]|uniref:hypothetical protein n=1 Tax=Antarctobacter jejuensis TaxID=1439938 RepID=UPI003FCF6DAA